MLETLIIVLILLWALGFLGAPLVVGNAIHVLLLLILILVVVRLLQGGPWFRR